MGDNKEWIRVASVREMTCPICGKPDWCMVHKDGTAAICPRADITTPGYHKMTGGGPLFLLGDDDGGDRVALPRPMPPYKPPEDTTTRPNWRRAIPPMLDATDYGARIGLSESIGVSTEALERLESCYSAKTHTWGFPIRDWNRNYVGVLLRRRDRKVRSRWRKWCVRGSRLGIGLHIPKGTFLGSAIDCYPPEDDEQWHHCVLCIAEGVTDTAVLVDYGFHVVGRTSCTASVDTLARIEGRIVWIFADDDPKPQLGGGSRNPELDGAFALARKLCQRNMEVRVVRPMAGKDVREWKRLKKPQKSTLVAVANNAPRMTESGVV